MLRYIANVRILPAVVRTMRPLSSDGGVFTPPSEGMSSPPVPEYQARAGESLEVKRARLMYQSRKRGMLENDLLLSSFTHRHLGGMNQTQVDQLDEILNKPSNDWDIFEWITGKTEVPARYDNEVMSMLKEFVKNTNYEDRTRMPELKL